MGVAIAFVNIMHIGRIQILQIISGDTMRRLTRSLVAMVAVHLYTLNAFTDEIQFYSQYQQDQYVYENFFKDKKNGVFVDIGAHDGVTLSNTYFFEKNMDWTGVCVEPNPEVYESLKNNRKCLCVQGCIYDKKDSAPFLKISGWAEMLSGIVENYDPKHVKRIQWEIELNGGESEVIDVKCYNLTDLLLENDIRHVDYLSIDTEGGELGILQSIDFSQIDIDVIEVENNYQTPFSELLEPLGYEKIGKKGPDEIYRKKKDYFL